MLRIMNKISSLILILTVLALLLSFAGRPALAAEETGEQPMDAGSTDPAEEIPSGPDVPEDPECPIMDTLETDTEYLSDSESQADPDLPEEKPEEESPGIVSDEAGTLPDASVTADEADPDPSDDPEITAPGTPAAEEENGSGTDACRETVLTETASEEEPALAALPEPEAQADARPAEGGVHPAETVGSEIPKGTVQVTVVKENGEEFKMFKAKASTAVLNGEWIDIVFVTDNVSFDKIYVGSKDDAEKTDFFTGKQLENGGFRFEFSVEKALNGTRTEVALGKLDGSWYSGMTLYLVIPDLEEPETPDDPGEPGNPEEPEGPEEPEDPTAPEGPMISDDGVLADGIYSAEVETGQAMFKVVDCVITSEDGKMTAVITLSGTGYDYLYLGSAKDAYAADGEGWIPFEEDPETGKYTYTLELASVTEPVSVAARSARYASEGKGEAAWFDRVLSIVLDSIVKTADLPGEEDEVPADPSGEEKTDPGSGSEEKPDDSGRDSGKEQQPDEPENTGTQDEDEIRKMEENTKKGTVVDGTYVPSFGFTGGTGKVTISCPKLVVKDGKGTATLVFSSSKYTYVLVNGTKYYNENSGGKSTFTIPVRVNGTTSISAETTAMSEAHLIDYVLYIYVDGQDVSGIRPSSASGETETDTEEKRQEQTETAEEEEGFGPDGRKNGASGWGEYDSVQTTEESVPTEETGIPTAGTEDMTPAAETEKQAETKSFSAWYGVGIGAAVVALAAGGAVALRKGKKKA